MAALHCFVQKHYYVFWGFFNVSGLIIQTRTGKHISTRQPVFFAFLAQVFILPYQSLLSSILSIWSQSVQGKEKKNHSTQAEKHQIGGYVRQGSVVRLVFIVSWVFPSLLSAQEGFYRPKEILQSSFSSTHVRFR